MMLGTWTYSVDGSKALTIFQKQRATNDYSVWDIAGTSSGQNPEYPTLAGNGPTRYAYHGLNSGSSIQWEYSNARVGQQAQFWNPPDIYPLPRRSRQHKGYNLLGLQHTDVQDGAGIRLFVESDLFRDTAGRAGEGIR